MEGDPIPTPGMPRPVRPEVSPPGVNARLAARQPLGLGLGLSPEQRAGFRQASTGGTLGRWMTGHPGAAERFGDRLANPYAGSGMADRAQGFVNESNMAQAGQTPDRAEADRQALLARAGGQPLDRAMTQPFMARDAGRGISKGPASLPGPDMARPAPGPGVARTSVGPHAYRSMVRMAPARGGYR